MNTTVESVVKELREHFGEAEIKAAAEAQGLNIGDLLDRVVDGFPEQEVEAPCDARVAIVGRSGPEAEVPDVLYADADGATPIAEEGKLSAAIANGADVAVGSRLVDEHGVARHRDFTRGLAGRVLNQRKDWAIRMAGLDGRGNQATRLLAEGVPGLHFYTLNRSTATREVHAALV